jgi:hypothetical protein
VQEPRLAGDVGDGVTRRLIIERRARSAVISEVDGSNELPEHEQDSDDNQGDSHDRQ